MEGLTSICKSNYDHDIIYFDLGNLWNGFKSSLEVWRQTCKVIYLGRNGRLDGLESQEVDVSSEVYVCLLVVT